MPYLSKSNFLRGSQCEKSLFLNLYHPELKDEVSKLQQAIFDTGHLVGKEAQRLFPGGMDASRGRFERIAEAVKYTQELIRDGQPVIYEAAFEYEDNICYLDVLVKDMDGWGAYEVKGSTEVKEYYYQDTAFQYYVITRSGFPLEDISLVHVNREYVRQGPLDPDKLFSIVPVTAEALRRQESIIKDIARYRQVLSQRTIPEVPIGPQCDTPYTCDFLGHCWKHVPEYSVFDLAGLAGQKKWELYGKGILKPEDIPVDFPLSAKQRQQLKADKSGEVHIDKDRIREFLNGLQYPLYFLDFESFQPPIPLFDRSRPYQQVVFQYSLHIMEGSGTTLIHREFLAEAAGDPRLPFLDRLLEDVGEKGDIIVYNRSFEASRLAELAKDFPDYEARIAAILVRLKDLMVIFQQRHYYTPGMRGSYSIKQVLPALVSDAGYKDLEIAEGSIASLSFAQLYGETDLFTIMTTRENLLRYCEMDTLAMVKLMETLEEVVPSDE